MTSPRMLFLIFHCFICSFCNKWSAFYMLHMIANSAKSASNHVMRLFLFVVPLCRIIQYLFHFPSVSSCQLQHREMPLYHALCITIWLQHMIMQWSAWDADVPVNMTDCSSVHAVFYNKFPSLKMRGKRQDAVIQLTDQLNINHEFVLKCFTSVGKAPVKKIYFKCIQWVIQTVNNNRQSTQIPRMCTRVCRSGVHQSVAEMWMAYLSYSSFPDMHLKTFWWSYIIHEYIICYTWANKFAPQRHRDRRICSSWGSSTDTITFLEHCTLESLALLNTDSYYDSSASINHDEVLFLIIIFYFSSLHPLSSTLRPS